MSTKELISVNNMYNQYIKIVNHIIKFTKYNINKNILDADILISKKYENDNIRLDILKYIEGEIEEANISIDNCYNAYLEFILIVFIQCRIDISLLDFDYATNDMIQNITKDDKIKQDMNLSEAESVLNSETINVLEQIHEIEKILLINIHGVFKNYNI